MSRRARPRLLPASLGALLVAAALSGCARWAAQQLVEHTQVGDTMSLLPAMNVARLVSDYREATGRCPVSREQLESELAGSPGSGRPPASVLDGFDRLAFYAGDGSLCIIEYRQPRQRLSQAMGEAPADPGGELWLPPRRGILRLRPSRNEGQVRTTPFTLDLFETTGAGSGRVAESALPPSEGTLSYDRELRRLEYQLKPAAE